MSKKKNKNKKGGVRTVSKGIAAAALATVGLMAGFGNANDPITGAGLSANNSLVLRNSEQGKSEVFNHWSSKIEQGNEVQESEEFNAGDGFYSSEMVSPAGNSNTIGENQPDNSSLTKKLSHVDKFRSVVEKSMENDVNEQYVTPYSQHALTKNRHKLSPLRKQRNVDSGSIKQSSFVEKFRNVVEKSMENADRNHLQPTMVNTNGIRLEPIKDHNSYVEKLEKILKETEKLKK